MAGEIILIDAGPLVALADRKDHFHNWAKRQVAALPLPFISCEAVLSETQHLLQREPGGNERLLDIISQGLIRCPFHLDLHMPRVIQLMRKYSDVPMSLADACLVCMAEDTRQGTVFTIDSDFRVYRKSGRMEIPVIMPSEDNE